MLTCPPLFVVGLDPLTDHRAAALSMSSCGAPASIRSASYQSGCVQESTHRPILEPLTDRLTGCR
jgi:hypothetical protein